MTISVVLHGSLSAFANGMSEHSIDARSVREALDQLTGRFSGLRDRVYDDKGVLRPFVNVYLNDSRIATVDDPVKDNDIVTLIPAIAGG